MQLIYGAARVSCCTATTDLIVPGPLAVLDRVVDLFTITSWGYVGAIDTAGAAATAASAATTAGADVRTITAFTAASAGAAGANTKCRPSVFLQVKPKQAVPMVITVRNLAAAPSVGRVHPSLFELLDGRCRSSRTALAALGCHRHIAGNEERSHFCGDLVRVSALAAIFARILRFHIGGVVAAIFATDFQIAAGFRINGCEVSTFST